MDGGSEVRRLCRGLRLVINEKSEEATLHFFSFQGLPNVLQQIFTGFETDAEADRRIRDRHLRTLFWREESEDG